MIKLAVGEYQFQTASDELRRAITAMAQEFGTDWGMDWQFETRWVKMTAEQYMLAKIKYTPVINYMVVSKC